MTEEQARRLEAYQARLRELAADLANTGFIKSGSLVHRYTACGTPGCRCQAEPPQRHGPYWQWTARVGGKTVTRRLTETQAALYGQWIANRRRLNEIVAQMEHVSQKAGEMILNDRVATQPPAKRR